MGQAAVTTLVGLGLLVVAGCGGDDSGIARRYAVSGKVTYKGQPVEKGTIVFEPTDVTKARVASGAIENGFYTLTTTGEKDGALPGDYKVCIISRSVDMSGVEANRKGGAGRQDDVYKAEKKAQNLIPPKYQRTDSSGLTFKVEEKSNTKNFELTD